MLKRASEKRIFDFDKKAVGFWMEAEGIVSARFVRIFVTHEALSDIDPNGVPDFDGDLSTFDKNRDRIELAANSKFDRGETEDWLHEGARSSADGHRSLAAYRGTLPRLVELGLKAKSQMKRCEVGQCAHRACRHRRGDQCVLFSLACCSRPRGSQRAPPLTL